MTTPRFRASASVIGAPDARALATFYEQLLGWTRTADEPGWVMLKPLDGGLGLSFQEESAYVAPVWPTEAGSQQMMVHLDIGTDDLEAGVQRAVDIGATVAAVQPQPHVRVMLDPVGHPFCLFAVEI